MAKISRAKLKNYFLKGNIPTENQFHDLIDSSMNQKDDSIEKNQGEALGLSSEGSSDELLRFFKNMEDKNPQWIISGKSKDGDVGFNISDSDNNSKFFIEDRGKVGIGTTKPQNKLEVIGSVGMQGREGLYAHGEIPADGQWYTVIGNIEDYCGFEIIANVGTKGAHSAMHAIAMSAYGQSKSKIRKTQGYFGRCRNCIDLRFSGSYFDYALQIRTKRNYGDGINIKYNIAKIL